MRLGIIAEEGSRLVARNPQNPGISVTRNADARMSVARSGDRRVAPPDSPVDEQSGQQPGDLDMAVIFNQNATTERSGDLLTKQVGRWLFEHIDPFGAGKTGAPWIKN